jgi:hypothetical protein
MPTRRPAVQPRLKAPTFAGPRTLSSGVPPALAPLAAPIDSVLKPLEQGLDLFMGTLGFAPSLTGDALCRPGDPCSLPFGGVQSLAEQAGLSPEAAQYVIDAGRQGGFGTPGGGGGGGEGVSTGFASFWEK